MNKVAQIADKALASIIFGVFDVGKFFLSDLPNKVYFWFNGR